MTVPSQEVRTEDVSVRSQQHGAGAGCLALILHAHLPYVRHPEHERSLEEQWLFEAIVECYLPLLEVMEGWARARLPVRLTLSLSPTLAAMLLDPLLQRRAARYLDERVQLAEREILRHHWQPKPRRIAEFYRERLASLRERFLGMGCNIVATLGRLQEAGTIEIITCPATHAVLPLLVPHPGWIRTQIQVACEEYERCFGRRTQGFWLAECAYTPEVEGPLREAAIRWTVTETHGLLHAKPRPRLGVSAPVLTRRGLAVFGRDPASARQVWSRREGYPGDPRYREFHRDLAHDADLDYLGPILPVADRRTFTGLKYHRVTGHTEEKEWYDREAALEAARAHAAHFVEERERYCLAADQYPGQPPVIVAPYDAELFGHWWFEGPEFLDALVRKACEERHELRLITPSDYLDQDPRLQVAEPAASSWGDGGHLKMWLNPANSWLYPRLRQVQARLEAMAVRDRDGAGLTRRAMTQAVRELLLAQASDWAFILSTGTSPGYARRRFEGHLASCEELCNQVERNAVEEAYLSVLEQRNGLFPRLTLDRWRR